MKKRRAFPGRVFFDHLPKTAGTAITSWLRQELGSGSINAHHLWGDHRTLIRQYGGAHSIIGAHSVFQDAEGFDPRYQYVTIFREPVDRVLSWIYFTMHNRDPRRVDAEKAISHAKDFIDSDGQVVHEVLLGDISNVYVEHFCRIYGDGRESDDEKLANSLKAIKQYDVVGIYERMPLFLTDVARLIGFPVPETIPRGHVTKKRRSVGETSPALLERIVALNRLDIRLYDEVLAWKESAASENAPDPINDGQPRWEKFNPVWGRMISTPDVIIGGATLREGSVIARGQLMTFDLDFVLSRQVRELEVGIHIFDPERRWVFGTNNVLLGRPHQWVPDGSYRATYHLVADLPTGRYTVGFAVAELLPEGKRELAWRDVLCDFDILHDPGKPFAGYAYLPAELSLRPVAPARKITRAEGAMKLKTPIARMKRGAVEQVEVEIFNRSKQPWEWSSYYPISLCYHWLNDSGHCVLMDGVRTRMPVKSIYPGQSAAADMRVRAPEQAGKHILVLTMVQEKVCWFEEKGFEPVRTEVEVTA